MQIQNVDWKVNLNKRVPFAELLSRFDGQVRKFLKLFPTLKVYQRLLYVVATYGARKDTLNSR